MKEVIGDNLVARRLVRHQDGDWNKLEKLTKEIIKQAEMIEGFCEKLAKEDQRLRILCADAYALAPKVDCLYMDSPIAPHKNTFHIKAQLKKFGWDGIRDVMIENILIESFAKVMKDNCRWLLKFKDDQNT